MAAKMVFVVLVTMAAASVWAQDLNQRRNARSTYACLLTAGVPVDGGPGFDPVSVAIAVLALEPARAADADDGLVLSTLGRLYLAGDRFADARKIAKRFIGQGTRLDALVNARLITKAWKPLREWSSRRSDEKLL